MGRCGWRLANCVEASQISSTAVSSLDGPVSENGPQLLLTDALGPADSEKVIEERKQSLRRQQTAIDCPQRSVKADRKQCKQECVSLLFALTNLVVNTFCTIPLICGRSPMELLHEGEGWDALFQPSRPLIIPALDTKSTAPMPWAAPSQLVVEVHCWAHFVAQGFVPPACEIRRRRCLAPHLLNSAERSPFPCGSCARFRLESRLWQNLRTHGRTSLSASSSASNSRRRCSAVMPDGPRARS